MAIFDPDTLERFRGASPRDVFWEAKAAIYRTGAASSEDFLDAFEEIVDAGILSWEQVEEFERGS